MDQIIDDWLRWLSGSRGRSDATIVKYRGYLTWFAEFLGERDLADVDLALLETFTGEHLFKVRGLKARSRSVAVAAIRNFFSWAVKHGLIGANPSVNLGYPSIGRRLPRSISLQDAEKLLHAPDLNTFIGVRDAAMISLLIGCGMRISGLCGLNQSSLIWTKDHKDRDRLIIRVLEKGGKERLVPAPSEAMLMLRAYLGHSELGSIDRYLPDGDQVLFVSTKNNLVPAHEYHGENRRIAPRSVNDRLEVYAKQVGVSMEFAHPHAFRHLYGTEFVESDVNLLTLKTLLGHERSDTTEIYTHLAMRKLTDDVERANPLGKMRTPVSDLLKQLGL
jgi:integrase/recombinase XerD